MIKNRKIYLIVFMASFSSLAYEITLTRIFSVSLWYHFAFMVISIAMLGLAASGTFLSLFSKLQKIAKLELYCFWLALSIALSYLISLQIPFDPVKLQWSKIQIFYISFYYIILLFPFFFTGLIIASAFSHISKKSAILYGADLMGASLGSISILLIIKWIGPESTVFLLSSILFLLTFLLTRDRLKLAALILFFLTLMVLYIKPGFSILKPSPYKEMPLALQYPGSSHLKTRYDGFSRIDIFRSPAVRFAPGLSLKYLETLPEQIGFSIDGDNIGAITNVHDKKKLEFLTNLPAALPYEIAFRKDVLILDPRGGLHILLARQYKSQNINKVESNPLLVRTINKYYSHFSGHIYRDLTWEGLGRSWLKSQKKKYDMIDIPLTKSVPSGHSGFSVDYRFTVEAFQEYIKHLKPEGMLSLSGFIIPPPATELRLLNTMISAMEDYGMKNPAFHLAALRSWATIIMVIKKTPLTQSDIKKIKEFARQKMFDLIYYPGIQPGESNIFIRSAQNTFFHAFQKIISKSEQNKFASDYLFDILPVTDDKPFFYYSLKFKNIKKIYRITGGKWDYFIREGYILPFILFQVTFFGLILIFLPAIFRVKMEKDKIKTASSNHTLILILFACLGIGFMFVEISLIQKSILLLENPYLAMATVLASILTGSGSGSFLSYKYKRLQNPLILFIIPVVIFIYILVLPGLPTFTASLPLNLKFLLSFILLIPAGFFLGIPFPTAIKFLGERQKKLIPWAWAVNGCFSVMGPILAIQIALSYGFTFVLILGAFAYLLVSLIFYFWKKVR